MFPPSLLKNIQGLENLIKLSVHLQDFCCGVFHNRLFSSSQDYGTKTKRSALWGFPCLTVPLVILLHHSFSRDPQILPLSLFLHQCSEPILIINRFLSGKQQKVRGKQTKIYRCFVMQTRKRDFYCLAENRLLYWARQS